jgi:DNA/RNA non-specific endonuclease
VANESETAERTVNGFRFWSKTTNDHQIKYAAGKLQVPGTAGARDLKAQRAVSRGTGDDAGHLIGHQFGGPEIPGNLSLQHYGQNRGGGTFYDLEKRWAEKLQAGVSIDVEIREMTRAGEDRPYHRHVEWTEGVGPSQRREVADFMNAESQRGRLAKGIVPETYKDSVVVELRPGAIQKARESAESKELNPSALVKANKIGAELGNDDIKRDMNMAREQLLQGREAPTVAKTIGNERGGTSVARAYARDLVASVKRQLGPELAKILGPELSR